MSQQRHQKAIDELNKLVAKMLPQQPSFRYYTAQVTDPKTGKRIWDKRYAFAWTTERTSDKKFYSLKYRLIKQKNGILWRLIHKVPFGKRRIAKARAVAWCKKHEAKMAAKRQVLATS